MKVRILYDYLGDVANGELVVTANEIITVTRTDIEDGWWEGTNEDGITGLFPEVYCQKLDDKDDESHTQFLDLPPPPPLQEEMEYDLPLPPPPPIDTNFHETQISKSIATSNSIDKWSDEDSDEDLYEAVPATSNTTVAKQQSPLPSIPTTHFSESTQNSLSSSVLNLNNLTIKDSEKICIQKSNIEDEYMWRRFSDPYTVEVRSPKKEKKYVGMKSFIAYQLCPSFSKNTVSRRYKHFDWLHRRLIEKFTIIPIPNLPDKQISGRYEEQFVEHRRSQLQNFVDWLCRHPILACCDVWVNFLVCDDIKSWKQMKRTAEKDQLIRLKLCNTMYLPDVLIPVSKVETIIEGSIGFTSSMNVAIKDMSTVCKNHTKTFQILLRRDFKKFGECCLNLAKSLEVDDLRVKRNYTLAAPFIKAGGIFIKLGDLFGEQPKLDWIPFQDILYLYSGVLSCYPNIIVEYRNTLAKRREQEKATAEMKNLQQLQETNRRIDFISYALFAELTHFREERETELRQSIINLIDEQLSFYDKVRHSLKSVKKVFEI